MNFKICFAVLIISILPVFVFGQADIPATNVKQNLKRIQRSHNIQTELPGRGINKDITDDASRNMDWMKTPMSIPGGFARILMMISVIVVLGVLVYLFFNNYLDRSRSLNIEKDDNYKADKEIGESSQRMKLAYNRAEDAAQKGDYAEAMHILLLQSLNELRVRMSLSIAVSMTSREVLRNTILPGEGSKFFEDIVKRVELSYFGGYPVDEDDYLACQNSFNMLAATLRQGG